MPRKKIEVVAIKDGVAKVYESISSFAKEVGVNHVSALNTLNRGGCIRGYEIYYTPEYLYDKIEEISNTICYLKKLGL